MVKSKFVKKEDGFRVTMKEQKAAKRNNKQSAKRNTRNRNADSLPKLANVVSGVVLYNRPAISGKKAKRNLMPMQAGDVLSTWADSSLLEHLTGYKPRTDLIEGTAKFVSWYRDYYNI